MHGSSQFSPQQNLRQTAFEANAKNGGNFFQAPNTQSSATTNTTTINHQTSAMNMHQQQASTFNPQSTNYPKAPANQKYMVI